MELELTGISKSYNGGKTYAVSDLSVRYTPGITVCSAKTEQGKAR